MRARPRRVARPVSALQRAAANLAAAWTTTVSVGQPIVSLVKFKGDFLSACTVCRNLSVTHAGLEVHLGSLHLPAQRDCPSCALLKKVVEPYSLGSNDSTIFLLREGNGTLKLRFDLDDDDSDGIELELYVLSGASSPWPTIKPSHDDFGVSKFSTSIRQISEWLEECTTHHEYGVCRSLSTPQLLPTRLLEIQGAEQVRLYTPQPEERAKYACLSHCWGGVVAIKATRANQHEYHHQIVWTQLPQTFQDAVRLTWHIGLKFLSIDSLCILQDDDEDWRHEGSKMATIYAHSYITLAATNSANANGGLYTDSSSAVPTRIHILKHEFKDAVPHAIRVRTALQHKTFFNESLPLMTRAWAFQERLLSPRIVHFADEELYWECTSAASCECGHCGPGYWYGLNKTEFTSATSVRRVEPSNDDTGILRYGLREQWYHIVSQYTRLQVTFEKDVFPALQGVVKQIQTRMQCNYYAGLWEDFIVTDLLWAYYDSDASLHSVYRAPTWSWAARTGSPFWLTFHEFNGGAVSVVSISTTPVGLDPTGEISNGVLVLQGKHVTAVVTSCPRYGFLNTGKLSLDLEAQLHLHLNTTPFGEGEDDGYRCNLDVVIKERTSVELLLILKGFGHLMFLILRELPEARSSSDEMRTYERLGAGTIHTFGDRGKMAAKCFETVEQDTLRII